MQRLPLLMIPLDQEKLLYARCVQEHGLGITTLPQIQPPDWLALIRRLIEDDATAQRIDTLASKYASLTESKGVDAALAAIEAALT